MKRSLVLTAAFSILVAFGAFAQLKPAAFTGKPMYKISVKRAGIPIGDITVELFPNIAPKHARNFDSLATKTPVGFYDTTAFHRVIPGFMIQGGDPNSRHGAVSTWGFGQPGQTTVPAEFTAARHVRGILSAARSTNPNSATSQFFICVATASQLDNNYSVYGRTIAGMNIVDTIVLAPRNAQDRPNLKHEMFITYLGSDDTIPNPPTPLFPPTDTSGIDASSPLLLKWKGVSDGILYQLEVSTSSTFAYGVVTQNLGSLGNYFSNMDIDSTYYWHVRTNNGGKYSAWSPTWKFHTFEKPSSLGLSSIAAGQNVVSVFPNPGNGLFTFSDVASGSTVSIYDSAGKLVFETVAQKSRVVANLEHKDKGIYFYKVSLDGKKTYKGQLVIK